MTEGLASISSDILARYASDAACEIEGVRGIAGRRGVRIREGVVELRLDVGWGFRLPTLARRVQERVREYLRQMAGVEPSHVDIVIERIGPVE